MSFMLDNSAKTNWKFIGIVAILGVLVGGSLLLYSSSGIEEETPQIVIEPEEEIQATISSSIQFSGEVSRDQIFEKEVGEDLVFRLIPRQHGWDIAVGNSTDPELDFSRITLPLRGINSRQLNGWHFRNADNTGINEGSVNAPQEVREFEFILREQDYRLALDALITLSYPQDYTDGEVDRASKQLYGDLQRGRGTLTVTDMKFGNLDTGEQAWFEHIKFDVEIVLPPSISDWQTYRNEKFGFEFQYPNDWQVDEERSEPSFTSLIVRPQAEEGERNDLDILIRDYDNESQTMSKEAVEELFDIYRSLEVGEVYAPPGTRFAAGRKIKNIVIDNYIAPRLGSGQETSISTYVAAQNHHFQFMLRLESYATLEKFERLTDQILSTFRFLKPIDQVVAFCSNQDSSYQYDQAIYFQADDDAEREIVGICWNGTRVDRHMILFILDDKSENHALFTQQEDSTAQRYRTFENLRIEDINQDGIEEIMYTSKGWHISGGTSSLSLYSPKDEKWFSVTKKSGGELRYPEITFPTTFTPEQQFIKEFLSREVEELPTFGGLG